MKVNLMHVVGHLTMDFPTEDSDTAKLMARTWLNNPDHVVKFVPASYVIIVSEQDMVNDKKFDERVKKSSTENLDKLWEKGRDSNGPTDSSNQPS
jgi:hypothetical protein